MERLTLKNEVKQEWKKKVEDYDCYLERHKRRQKRLTRNKIRVNAANGLKEESKRKRERKKEREREREREGEREMIKLWKTVKIENKQDR